jgi:hypothetical protein
MVMGIVLLTAVSVSAQSTPGKAVSNVVGSLLSPMLNVLLEPVVTGEPYTATRVTTTVQKLQDGTTISHHERRHLMRDNEGRIREQQVLVKAKGDDPGIKMVFVKDPVSNSFITWTESAKGNKEAIEMKLPDLKTTAKQVDAVAAAKKKGDPVEDLGQQSIQGWLVTGQRITHVIPAGSDGNDQSITETSEIWTAPDLKLRVKEVHNDPRSGVTTKELENFSRENPPIAMFQPPAGYTIKTNEQAMKEMQAKIAAAKSE